MVSVSCIRPSRKTMKIAYNVLKTPKQLQQASKSSKAEEEKRMQRWYTDSKYRN